MHTKTYFSSQHICFFFFLYLIPLCHSWVSDDGICLTLYCVPKVFSLQTHSVLAAWQVKRFQFTRSLQARESPTELFERHYELP